MKRLWQHSSSVEHTPCAGPLAHFWTVLQAEMEGPFDIIEIFGRVALVRDGLSYYFKGQRESERETH